jgi:hypothetical protein
MTHPATSGLTTSSTPHLRTLPRTVSSTLSMIAIRASIIRATGQWRQTTTRTSDTPVTGAHKGAPFSWISKARPLSKVSFRSNVSSGTSVSVYGRVGNDSTNSASQMSFTLDGTSPVVYSAPYQSAVSYNMPLFQSEALEQGKHSLVAASQCVSVSPSVQR